MTVQHSFMTCTLSDIYVEFHVAHVCSVSRACLYNAPVLATVVGFGGF